MKVEYKHLGNYIRQVDERNRDMSIEKLLGVSITKQFIPSIANIVGTDLSNYKIVRTGQFAYGPVTSRNGEKISIAFLQEEDCIISSSYSVFEVIDKGVLNPEYLILWFSRPEFDRYARYRSHGSVREIFDWEELCQIELPVPAIEKQNEIVEAYRVVKDRIALKQKINDNLTEQCIVDYTMMLGDYTTESSDLPDGWSIGSIGSYCDVKSGYAFKSEWWTNEGHKVIKIANIVNNSIDLDSCDHVAPANAEKAVSFYVKPGDILIAMTGATTGKIGVVPYCDEPIVVNQRVGCFFLGDNPLEKAPFLFSTLLYGRVSRHLQPDGTAGSAQDNLSADNIKDVAIVVPTTKEIETFNKVHLHHLKSIMLNNAEIRTLSKLLNIMLSQISDR